MQSAPPAVQAGEAQPDPKRILVRGVNWLGDAVMTTPALLRLRERFPQASITLLTREKLVSLWDHHLAIDFVRHFASQDSPWSVGRRLREQQFDLAVVLPNSHRAALECWLARVPRRLGHARPWRNWLLTQAVPARAGQMPMRKKSPREIQKMVRDGPAGKPEMPPSAHQVYEYLHLVAALGADAAPLAPQLFVKAEEIELVRHRFPLDASSDKGAPLFALHPGAEYGPAKRWPIESFIAAAQEIRRRTGCRWLLLGGPADLALTSQIQARLSDNAAAQNLAGRTSLRELCAILKLCRVLLTNDTGPMHVAAALGIPVVVPFGSTSAALTGPGLPGDSRHRLLFSNAPCSPCFLRACPIDFRCMKSITVQAVTEAVIASCGLPLTQTYSPSQNLKSQA
jgi:heptosyltransferase II